MSHPSGAPPLPPFGGVPLVGRGQQLRRLMACLQEARQPTNASRPTVVLLAGVPGIGKTRLLNSLLHDRLLRKLHLPHIQLDELRTRLRCRAHILWVWIAIDPISKLIPVLHLGPRTQNVAHRVVHDLHERLAPGCTPIFASDGLNQYFSALTAHFGQWIVGVGRRAPVAGRGWAALRPSQKALSASAVGRGDVCATLWDARSAADGFAGAGVERTAEYCVCGASESDPSTKRGRFDPSHLVDHAGGAAVAHASRMVAGILSLRAAPESLQEALDQPIQRDGKRIPRRYRQRTPAWRLD
jgi:hypothetical protein